MFPSYLHSFILKLILEHTKFPALNLLLKDKDAAQILLQSKRLTSCINYEQELLKKNVNNENHHEFLSSRISYGQQEVLRSMRETEIIDLDPNQSQSVVDNAPSMK